MRLGVDVSNIKGGGGLSHLIEVLAAVDPREFRFDRVVVWGAEDLLKRLPSRPWIDYSHQRELDRGLVDRIAWQVATLPGLAQRECDLLFVPGSLFPGEFHPFVTMVRNQLPFEDDEMLRYGLSRDFLRLALLRLAQGWTFRRAQGVIFLSTYSKGPVLKMVGPLPGETAVVAHGAGNRFRTPQKEQKPLATYSPDAPMKLLYVSIIDMYKHQWVVAEAVARLRRRGMPLVLDLVGPAYPPALERLNQTLDQVDPTRSFIRYHGVVPYAELHEIYAAADLFVYASTCETFGIVLLEAMSAGLPIACSNRGPFKEILGPCGVYFDPERVSDVESQLAHIINDVTLRSNYARACRERTERFSWERAARETFAFLEHIGERQVLIGGKSN